MNYLKEFTNTPWKGLLEIKRILIHPLVMLYLNLNGVTLGKNTKWYGFPKVMRHSNSKIEIGDNFESRNWMFSNPLGVNHPLILTTWQAGASIKIGKNVGITGGIICAAKEIEIGNNTLIGANSTIVDTDFHPITSNNRRYKSTGVVSKPVRIGINVFLGTGSMVLKGAHIGNNSVIGAGSIVVSDIPPNTIAAGSPARKIRSI